MGLNSRVRHLVAEQSEFLADNTTVYEATTILIESDTGGLKVADGMNIYSNLGYIWYPNMFNFPCKDFSSQLPDNLSTHDHVVFYVHNLGAPVMWSGTAWIYFDGTTI